MTSTPRPLTIGAFLPDATDATSFYRGAGPLAQLKRTHPEVQIAWGDLKNRAMWWTTMCASDVIFVQRPGSVSQLEAIKEAKCASKKVWIDFDDDLFHVPVSNPGYFHYSQPETRKILETAIKTADLVTVSTLALGQVVTPHLNTTARCVVIPNAYDDETFAWMSGALEPRQKVIVWRGSKTHDADVQVYAPAIIEVLKKHPDWKFHAFGDLPWMITEHLPAIQWSHSRLPILFYQRDLYNLKPAAVVVPLTDHLFNHSKSNIAYIEATLAGAATVAPSYLPEFQRPGIYGMNPETCAEVLKHVMEQTNTLQSMTALSLARRYLEDKIPLWKMNDERLKWIHWLIGGMQQDIGTRDTLKTQDG